MTQTADWEQLKLQDLCARLDVDYDGARNTLARGIRPRGVRQHPGRGNHRQYDRTQAFHLALILKLKAAGMTTTLAGKVAEWARVIQGMSVNLGWDHRFAPFSGNFQTEREWFVDVGDARFGRIATNAHPGKDTLYVTPWVELKSRKSAEGACPVVIFRVDIARLAHLLLEPVEC